MSERSRAELAAFLRSRRERLRPEEAGIIQNGRRRTPGLRREEVARLADVGVTWYTWLEQGRDINASESVLVAIARALRLDRSERDHVLTLAGIAPVERSDRCSGEDEVDLVTRRMLASLEPVPAVVVSARCDYLAYNRAALGLLGDLEALPEERRNSVWLCFTEPRIRQMMIEWELEMPHLVGLVRGAMAEHIGEPLWESLIGELCSVSEEFRSWWQDRRVSHPEPRVKKFLHPEAGLLRLLTRSYWLAPRSGRRLVAYAPVDEQSESRLGKLAASELPPWSQWSDLARDGAAALRDDRRPEQRQRLSWSSGASDV